jgi:hypothetical protein
MELQVHKDFFSMHRQQPEVKTTMLWRELHRMRPFLEEFGREVRRLAEIL